MKRIWLGWVVFFFAWSFVIHGALLVLHEVGGHGVAAMILGCGVDGFKLTYFGGGQTLTTQHTEYLLRDLVIVDSAGLVLTIGAGAGAMAFQRRAGLPPLTRLLVALLATWFLLHEFNYATLGGFYVLYDVRFPAVMLKANGLHVLAWLPPLVFYTVAALYGVRAIVDAFREHFGSRTRLHTLLQMAATLGTAGALFRVAYHLERTIRTDTAMVVAIPARAAQIAVEQALPPPFPIERVLLAIKVAAIILALARPVRRREGAEDAAPRTIPRRHAVGVAGAALVCAVTITLLVGAPLTRVTATVPAAAAPPPATSLPAQTP